MKFIFLFILISITATCISAQSDTQAGEKTVAYLRKFSSDYNKSMLDGKPEHVQAYYSDNIRLMPAFQKTVFGKSNRALYYKAFSSRFIIHDFTINDIEILDLGS